MCVRVCERACLRGKSVLVCAFERVWVCVCVRVRFFETVFVCGSVRVIVRPICGQQLKRDNKSKRSAGKTIT